MEQGSEEWIQARLGKATASRIADIIAKTKSGPARSSRENYAAELITERLTGLPYPHYTNASMQWGIDTEPQARNVYAFHADIDVVEIGFVPHPTIAMSGASPDGLVGLDGIIEVKCPDTATHIRTLEGEMIADKYLVQMQWQMCCTGRRWCDWVSYDPRMPDYANICIMRVHRDDERIADLERHVIQFLKEVDARTERIRALEKK